MAPSPTSAASLGRLGRYRLIDRIGWGGTAEVYTGVLGGMAGFEKKVVLKCLHGHLRGDAQYEQLFVDEAKRGAQVHHPHIVQTYELQRDPDSQALFMVLEHIDGVDLRTLMRHHPGPLPVELLAWVGTKLLQGLAHLGQDTQPGLVHCDVTPENLFLSNQGDVKLGDFGMATETTGSGGPFPGKVLGKVPYMSPEQAAGKAVDARSDVFSAAVVLWEALAGRRLFSGDSVAETVQQIRGAPRPKASDFNPKVPVALDALLHGALQVSAETRPATASVLRGELLQVLSALAPTVNEAELRSWLGRLVRDAQFNPPDAPALVDSPSTGVEASPIVSAYQSAAAGSPPSPKAAPRDSTDLDGTPARAIPPQARAGSASFSSPARRPLISDLDIPMPGQPAQVETHEIVKRDGNWDVRPAGSTGRLWVRGGRSVWGPFSLEPTVARLLRVPVGALQRVSLSRDGDNWQTLSQLLQELGLQLVPEDAHLPQARLQGDLGNFDLVSVLGFLQRHGATGRLIVVHDAEAGPERRDIDVREGRLVAVHANPSILRTAAASVLAERAPPPTSAASGRELSEMLAWRTGRLYFDEQHQPQGVAERALGWRLAGRLHRACSSQELRKDLQPCWDVPLHRSPGFDAAVDKMGLLGWESDCLQPFGLGFSLGEAIVQQVSTRAQAFALAMAYVLIKQGLLVDQDGQPALPTPLNTI